MSLENFTPKQWRIIAGQARKIAAECDKIAKFLEQNGVEHFTAEATTFRVGFCLIQGTAKEGRGRHPRRPKDPGRQAAVTVQKNISSASRNGTTRCAAAKYRSITTACARPLRRAHQHWCRDLAPRQPARGRLSVEPLDRRRGQVQTHLDATVGRVDLWPAGAGTRPAAPGFLRCFRHF